MRSIALFDEPPRITIGNTDAAGGSRNGMLIGMIAGERALEGIVCTEDGSVVVLDRSFFTIDWRYEVETNRWTDQNQPQG